MDFSDLFTYIKDVWSIEQIRMGIGGFISVDKVLNEEFDDYDGIYTPALSSSSSAQRAIKPQGKVFMRLPKRSMGQITSDVCQDGIICGRKWL